MTETLAPRSRKVKILATLGPASNTREMIRVADAGGRRCLPDQHEPRRPAAEGGAGRGHPRAGAGIPPADDDPVRPSGAQAQGRPLRGRRDAARRPASSSSSIATATPAMRTASNFRIPSCSRRSKPGAQHPDRRRQGPPEGRREQRRADRHRGPGRRARFGQQGRQRARRRRSDPGADRKGPRRTSHSRSSRRRTGSRCRSCSGRRMSPRRAR